MSRFFWFFSTTLVGFCSVSVPVYAQITEATTEINGLTCPFCSFGAKKKLKTVDGVDKVTVDIQKGQAILQANPGESIAVQQISAAVKKAGFAPGRVRVVATGRVQQQGERLLLDLSGQEASLLLNTTDLTQQEKLSSLAEQEVEIEVTGQWSIVEAEPYARLKPDFIHVR